MRESDFIKKFPEQAYKIGKKLITNSLASNLKNGMNKTEKRFADELELRKIAGDIKAWYFEKVKLKLARKTFYTPDFIAVLNDNTLEITEIKGGFIRDDSLVKFKVAKEMYPFMEWRMLQWQSGIWVRIK